MSSHQRSSPSAAKFASNTYKKVHKKKAGKKWLILAIVSIVIGALVAGFSSTFITNTLSQSSGAHAVAYGCTSVQTKSVSTLGWPLKTATVYEYEYDDANPYLHCPKKVVSNRANFLGNIVIYTAVIFGVLFAMSVSGIDSKLQEWS